MVPGYVRDATLDDAVELGPRLRPEDRAEIRAMAGSIDPTLALIGSVLLSGDNAKAIVTNAGEVIGLFGVVDDGDGIGGTVWLMASSTLEERRYALTFLRECHKWCDRMNAKFPLLHNYVDARNEVHLKWLKWCGCIFIKHEPSFGYERRPFIQFVRLRPCA